MLTSFPFHLESVVEPYLLVISVSDCYEYRTRTDLLILLVIVKISKENLNHQEMYRQDDI